MSRWLSNIFPLLTFLTSFLSSYLNCTATQLPTGRFLTDSVKIGEPIKYALVYHHNKNAELFFPDRRYNYYPFELITKEFYPTRTIGKISTDSTVYTLRTFEIKPIFQLALPVFILSSGGDTVVIYSSKDSIFHKPLLKNFSENNKLLEQTRVHPLLIRFNYPYFIFVAVVVLVVFLFLFFLFRKPIIKRYKLYFIKQGHKGFLTNYERLERDFNRKPELSVMEKALSLWKNYLSRLEDTPINTYTTTEIISLFQNEDLVQSLQVIDRSIYRGQISPEAAKSMTTLKRFSNQRYQLVKKEIINE